MSQGSSYEKLIADKLQDLPKPDMEASWQQMKLLLDKEMPEAGVVPPPPRGKAGWRLPVILFSALAVLVTGWLWYGHSLPGKNAEVVKNTSGDIHNRQAEQQESREAAASNTASSTVANKAPAVNTDIAVAPGDNNTEKVPGPVKEPKPSTLAFDKPVANGAAGKGDKLNGAFSTKGNHDDKLTGTENPVNDLTQLPLLKPVATMGNTLPHKTDQHIISNTTGTETNSNNQLDLNQHAPAPAAVVNQQTEKSLQYQPASVPRENYFSDDYQRMLSITGYSNQQQISVPPAVWTLPDVEKERKTILKNIRKAERRNERELAKSYRNTRSFWGAGTDRWFAAGIAPYQNLAVGAQQYYNYNAAGNRGVATDYIPAPYLQFHVTDRVYLLSEFQFNTPQATPNLLLAQKTNSNPLINWATENTYLRKMYYFNMPLSFYYSPFKNVYVGSGVQFSSFSSGLAYREQLDGNRSVMHSEVLKIREDSLSSSIRSSEWRYLVDANYYVDRFMFGFRYNQALNPYINIKQGANLGAVQARNQAFQFYIRYNIIVSKKR